MHHELSSLLAFLEELVQLLPVQQIVGFWAELKDGEEGSVCGREVRKLKIAASESFAKAVRERPLGLALILSRQIRAHQFGRVRSVVVEPRLRRLKVHDLLSKPVQDLSNILLMQLILQSLLGVYLELDQRGQHILHFFFSLRHPIILINFPSAMAYNSLGNSLSFSPVKSKGSTLAGPIISLKKVSSLIISSVNPFRVPSRNPAG